MRFEGRHGLLEAEQTNAQPFLVDVELLLNLQPAGVEDDISLTVDYREVYATCRQIVESTSFRLVEALAEAIAHELLAALPAAEVGVRVSKPQVDLGGPVEFVGVEVWRTRSAERRRWR
ncbi:MAG: dihydroneopterin aldolase [Chloroflexota bacterium]